MHDDFQSWATTYESQIDTPLARTLGGGSPQTFNRLKCDDLLQRLRTLGRDPSRMTFLDLGCGTGITESHLAGSFRRIIAADASEAMLQEARQKNIPGVEWLHAEASRVPLPDASVDVVLAMCLLHHASESTLPMILAEAQRVLTPGGLLAIYEHNPWNPVTRWVVSRCPIDADITWIQPARLRQQMLEAGFETPPTRFLFFFPRSLKPLLPLEPYLAWCPAGGQYVLMAHKKGSKRS